MNHADVRGRLYEFVRGEIPPDERQQVEMHLASCRKCRREAEALVLAFESLPPGSPRGSSQRGNAYWESFASRVERRIVLEKRPASIPDALRGLVVSVQQSRWRPAVRLAGALALVVLAFGVWLAVRSPRGVGDPHAEGVPAIPVSSQQAVGEYLTSSKMLLVGIANLNPEEGKPLDLGIERKAARSLVLQARLLSERSIDERSRELLQELERILIELANLEETADVPEVEMIRTGMRQQNILFKIRMAENQLGW